MSNKQTHNTMNIDNFTFQQVAIEVINKTAADMMGAVQIAMGMGMMNNNEDEGYTATYHMLQIEKQILVNGYAKYAGMTWTIGTDEFFTVA